MSKRRKPTDTTDLMRTRLRTLTEEELFKSRVAFCDFPAFEEVDLTPSAVSSRLTPDRCKSLQGEVLFREDLLRTRIRFILRTAFTNPIEFELHSVTESIKFSVNKTEEIIKSEAALHGWRVEMCFNEKQRTGLDNVLLHPQK